jgi:hypothetical protein
LNQENGPPTMMMTLTLYSMLVWFVWGLCMGAGWTIASWLLGKILR